VADAHFVFIFSLIASFFTVIAVPSNGLLIAEEKFIPISIIEIIRMLLNVAMAFFLIYYLGNRLRMYAVLMAVLTIANRVAFQIYCKIKYPEIVKFELNKNKRDYKEIFSFTGWTLLGASAVVGRTQGVAMVINLFFRNSINAAFGVAAQIGHAAGLFTNTLRQSVTPQIMKNQDNNPSRSLTLVYAISRYTYLIMLIMAVPLVLCMDFVLEIWLGKDNIPSMTAIFAIFIIIKGLVSNLGSGFEACIQATGKIRKMQIGYTIINLSIIPIVYILYSMGLPAYMSVIVGIFLTICTIVFESTIMREQTEFDYSNYLHKTILPTLCSTLLSFIPMIGLRMLFGNSRNDIWLIVISALWTSAIVFFFGIDKRERVEVTEFIKKKTISRK
jgi:O-antigen/teichoic acid export membrane protein